MRQGTETPNSPQGYFCRAVIAAEKEAEIRAVALIMRAAAQDPKHAQWWLTHRWPERWGEKTRIKSELTGADGADLIPSPLKEATTEELRKLLRRK